MAFSSNNGSCAKILQQVTSRHDQNISFDQVTQQVATFQNQGYQVCETKPIQFLFKTS